jgi:hypothetical protein
MFGVALEILWDVWWYYGDSVRYLGFLWRLGCLVLLWRFCGIFDVGLEILWGV